jgi:antitoxin component YwqK of YwqJK toxin-antitoxin module
MKKIILFSILAFLFASCSKEIDSSKMQMRDGLIYEVNAEKPFTGIVRNGDTEFISFKDGIRHGEFCIRKDNWSGYSVADESFFANLNGSCLVKGEVDNNGLDGDIVITYPNGQVAFRQSFDQGVPSGEAVEYSENGEVVGRITIEK